MDSHYWIFDQSDEDNLRVGYALKNEEDVIIGSILQDGGEQISIQMVLSIIVLICSMLLIVFMVYKSCTY